MSPTLGCSAGAEQVESGLVRIPRQAMRSGVSSHPPPHVIGNRKCKITLENLPSGQIL